MTRFKSIVFALALTLAISSSAFAGEITGKSGKVPNKSGEITGKAISGKTGEITGKKGEITGIVQTVLSVIGMLP